MEAGVRICHRLEVLRDRQRETAGPCVSVDWGNQSRSFMLTGDVGREARNALAPMPTLIPKGASPEVIQSAASRFAVLTDAAMANALAMGLA